MKHRGTEEEGHWVENFICGFLGGATGFFNFPGWLFIYFGWLSASTTLFICAAVGLAFGAWLALETVKEQRHNSTPETPQYRESE